MTTEIVSDAQHSTPEEVAINAEALITELNMFLPEAELVLAGEIGEAEKRAEIQLAELATRAERAEPRQFDAIENFPPLADEIIRLAELLPDMKLSLLQYADHYSSGRLVVDYARTETQESRYGYFNDRGEMYPVSREDIPVTNTTFTIFDRTTGYGVSFSSEHFSESRTYGEATTRSEKAALVYSDGTITQYYRVDSVEGTELLTQTGLSGAVEQLYGDEGLMPTAHADLLAREEQKRSVYLMAGHGYAI